MPGIVLIAIFICLGAIIYQDLKYRHLHVLWPVILFMAGGYALLEKFSRDSSMALVVTNSSFLLFVFLVLIGYMSLKNKGFLNPFKNYFGLGDLMFYIAITPFFVLTNYIVFFVLSMIFSIVIYFAFKKTINKTSIPLAGYASILLIFFLVKDLLFNYYPITLIR